MRKILSALKLSCLALLVMGCEKATDSTTVDGGTTTPTPTDPSTPTPATPVSTAPISLQMFTKYEGSTSTFDLKFTETGTTLCETTDSNVSSTCTVSVPEARLYYSSLNLKFEWKPDKCKLLTFQPYYYQASNSNAYVPFNGTDAIDCSGASEARTKPCFGGAAPELVTDFPKYNQYIYFPDETDPTARQSKLTTVPSAYSLKLPAINRLTVNDLPFAKWTTGFSSADMGGFADGYVMKSFVTYQWTCRDDWYDPISYSMTLNVKDEDSDTGRGPINDFKTWSGVP
jgi:hypothetical protein